MMIRSQRQEAPGAGAMVTSIARCSLPVFAAVPLAVSAGLGLAALAGCSPQPGGDDAGAPAPPVRLEEVAVIGCADCTGPEQITVATLAMDDAGTVYTLDLFEPVVRIFDGDGGLRSAFGSKGEGPGEFAGMAADIFIPGFAIYPEDGERFLVHQVVPPALVRFDIGGGHLGDLPLEFPSGQRQLPQASGWMPEARSVVLLTRLLMAAGAPISVFRLQVGDEAVQVSPVTTGDEIFGTRDPEAFAGRRFALGVAPDGTIFVGDTLAYELVRLAPDGRVTGNFGRVTARPRKTEAQLERERRMAARRGRPASEVEVDDVHFNSNSLQVDDAGRLWVWLNRPDPDRSVLDLFSGDGEYLGEVEIPHRILRDPRTLASFAVAGGRLAAAVTGPAGHHEIRVWRIVAP